MVSSAPTRATWQLRAARIAAAVAALAGSAAGLFLALYVAALTCDEGCSDPPTNWRNDSGAWQWDAQLAIAGLGAAIVIYALTRAIIGRRPWRALLAAAVVWGGWWAFVTS